MLDKPQQSDPSPAPRRVLVADDDGVMRMFVRKVLYDYEIVEARDGREALDALEASHDFQCVITDDRMPFASGFEIATCVRESTRLRHIPVVLMTATETNTAARQVESARAGAAAFLNKPFTSTQLRRLIDLMSRARPRPKIA